MFRVDGSLVPLKDGKRLPPEEVARLAFGIMNEIQKDKFKATNEVDLAYGVPGLGRFRVNVFQQRGTVGAVLRVIPFKILSIKDLLLPPVLETISLDERGLILVTGTTGSGKSTTLAAMIDHINASETNHIMTVEDPIEFLIRDKRSIINQREVGVDTVSFSQALKSALRQDPDVILVGEMRDLETIETALTAAETGHLVMSTLHTLDATETINRIISAFPPYQQKQVRLQLASVLKAPARVRELIEDKDRTKEIPEAIASGHQSYGTQTFDQSLMNLVKQSVITYEEAHRQATNPDDFALRFSGISATSDGRWDDFEGSAQDGNSAPGSVAFAQRGSPASAPATPPAAAAQRPASGPTVPLGRINPTQARPGTPASAPQKPAGGAAGLPSAEDDFHIERF